MRRPPAFARRLARREMLRCGISSGSPDGFEFFVPADLKASVDYKNGDLPGWIDLMASIGRAKEPSPS